MPGRAVGALCAALVASGGAALAGSPGLIVLVSKATKSHAAAADGVNAGAGAAGLGAPRRIELGGKPDAGAAALRALAPGEAGAVVAIGLEAARACVAAPPGRPVVFAMVVDPPGSGIFGLPDVWGISTRVAATMVLDRVRKHLPYVRRVGLPFDPKLGDAYVAEAEAAAKGRGLEIVRMPAAGAKALPDAWRAARARIDALWLSPVSESVLHDKAPREFLLDEALRDRLPIVAHLPPLRRGGPVLSIEADPAAIGREAARLAGRILRGERPPPGLAAPGESSVRTYCMRGLAERLGFRLASRDCEVEP